MDQGLEGGLRQERSNNISVSDVGHGIALLEEALDVLPEGLSRLLSAVLEVPNIPRAFVRALEVPHKDLSQIRPIVDPVGWEILEPCAG